MGVVKSGIMDPRTVEEIIYRAVVKPIASRVSYDKLEDPAVLEAIVLEMQRNKALQWMAHRPGGIGTLREVSYLKAKTYGKVTGEKILLLNTVTEEPFPSFIRSAGLDPRRTYLVTLFPGRAQEQAVDATLAVNHIEGIRKVALVAGEIEGGQKVIDGFRSALRTGEVRLNARLIN